MKKFSIYFITALFAPMTSALATDFPSAGSSAQAFSKYGQIQNVQNYSSNPFWTPGAAYNQRMPVPVYAQGTALDSAQCQSVVSQLIAIECGNRNNCIKTSLSDIKPTIMVQLSKLPDNNYVTACGGFIDSAFNDYTANYKSSVQNTGFPTAVSPGNNVQNQQDFKIENPYAPKSPQWAGEEWFGDIVGRTKELNKLQAQNADDTTLTATTMPKTINDVSFQDKMDNATAGYEEWKCNPETGEHCSYQQMKNIESDAYYLTRLQQMKNLKNQTSNTETGSYNKNSYNDNSEKSKTINAIMEELEKSLPK